jgi:cytochrome c-type biogenesis protein CcmH/NrfG
MTARRMAVVLIGVLALGAATAAQNKGKTKAQGKVVDEQGQPLGDVQVAAILDGTDKPFQTTKTNNKGEWKVENLAAGKWKFWFGKEGLEDQNVNMEVGESGTVSVPDVKIGKAVDHDALIKTEILKAADLMKAGKAGEARQIYEDLLAKYPQAQAPFRAQVYGAIAQTYVGENNAAQAAAQLKKATEIDPSNADLQVVYGEMLMQSNDPAQKAEGEKILLGMDLAKVKDPFPYKNVVISQINAQKSDEALALLDKLIAQFPNEASLLYYRGRANLAAKKLPEAKADLEKFVASATPDARELADAKKILEQMKDVK